MVYSVGVERVSEALRTGWYVGLEVPKHVISCSPNVWETMVQTVTTHVSYFLGITIWNLRLRIDGVRDFSRQHLIGSGTMKYKSTPNICHRNDCMLHIMTTAVEYLGAPRNASVICLGGGRGSRSEETAIHIDFEWDTRSFEKKTLLYIEKLFIKIGQPRQNSGAAHQKL